MKDQLTWIKIQDGIGWIKINRENKLNALNRDLIDELHFRFIDFQNHSSVKVIALTGSGDKAFVAGADISEFSILTSTDFPSSSGASRARAARCTFYSDSKLQSGISSPSSMM